MRITPSVAVAIASFFLAASCAFVTPNAGADDQAGTAEAKRLSSAVFAGGCFWCVEADFDKVEGVYETISGYTGGALDNPTYKQVSHGGTGHYEAVQVSYDPEIVSYAELTHYFFRHIDPVDARGQFCDKGASYLSAIFVSDEDERQIVAAEIEQINQSGVLPAPVVTEVLDAQTFWPAEDYHQDYYKKNPIRYRYYRNGCGRDKRVRELWGPSGAH